MSNTTMTTPLKELEKQGKVRQEQIEREAEKLAAWKPPTITWAELLQSNDTFRTNSIARANSFSSETLTLFHENRHGEDCVCLALAN